MDRVQAWLLTQVISRSRSKSRVLFPGGLEAEDLSYDQLAEFERADLTVAGSGGDGGRGTNRNGQISNVLGHGGKL